jgi:hypothetical protein
MSLATIIRDADLLAQSFDPKVLDAPGPDDYVEVVQETFCLACQTPVARFESRGGEMTHYAGDPMNGNIQPFDADHAPFLP